MTPILLLTSLPAKSDGVSVSAKTNYTRLYQIQATGIDSRLILTTIFSTTTRGARRGDRERARKREAEIND